MISGYDLEVNGRGAIRVVERDYDHNALAKMWLSGMDGLATGKIAPEQAMARKSWVYSAITAIARTGASVPMRIRTTTNRVVTRGPAVELFRNPSPRKTFKDLIYTTFLHLENAGNSYWFKEFSDSTRKPISIKPLDPRRMAPIIRDENLIGYIYRQIVGQYGKSLSYKDVPLGLDQVTQIMYPNPNSEWVGLAPLEACMDAVNTDIKAAAYNMAFFDNSAQPGGMLIHKRSISKTQQDQVKSAFSEEHGGVGRAHKMAVLAGDWEYKQLGLGQKDMEFLDQRKFSREEIGAVFGVPAVLMNDPNNSNYSTASVELRVFAESNWLPKLMMIQEVINTQIFAYYWPEMLLNFDIKEAPGLREDMGQKVDRAEKLFKMGVPLNNIITLLDIPIPATEWGDDWWVTSSMIKASSVQPLDPGAATQLPDPPKQKPPAAAQDPAAIKDLSREFARGLSGYLTKLRGECVSSAQAGDPLPFDLRRANEGISVAVDDVCRQAFDVGRDLVGAEPLAESRPTTPNVGILDLPSAIYETLSAPQGRERAARFIFDELRSKAKLLSHSQVGAAMHLGRLSGMESLGVESHRWVSASTADGVCCSQNQGAVVLLGEQFPDGCRYPLDPVGSQNPLCRCSTDPA